MRALVWNDDGTPRSYLNVLVVAQYFPPDLGGSATRAFNVARGLAQNGCNVTVVAAFPHYPHGKIPNEYRWMPFKVERIGGLKVIRTLMPPLESKGFGNRLLLMSAFSISSLFALPVVGDVDSVWASSWLPGLVFGRVKGKRVAINVDDLRIEDMYDLRLLKEGSIISKVAESVYRLFYVKGDVVTPISPGYVDTISSKYGVARQRIHILRGGVDPEIFRPSEDTKNHRETFRIAYSGAFSVAYDFDQVLRAAKILESKGGGYEFILQGKGELVRSVNSRITELDLKSVTVVDKLLSREEVARFLSDADALILPLADFGRPYLGISSKLYEYQALGKPIVCCGYGEPADYVAKTGSGITVSPGDSRTLAESVVYLKDNADKCAQMGARGRSYVKEHITIQAIGSELRHILESIVV
jgi:glycosyltransferase involved in cell wall biosynthesis